MKLKRWIAALLALATALGICTAALAANKDVSIVVRGGESVSETVYTPDHQIHQVKTVSGKLPSGLHYAYSTDELYIYGSTSSAGGSTIVLSVAEKVNGKPVDRLYLTHAELLEGGTLEFEMAPKPNKRRGMAADMKPYSL